MTPIREVKYISMDSYKSKRVNVTLKNIIKSMDQCKNGVLKQECKCVDLNKSTLFNVAK